MIRTVPHTAVTPTDKALTITADDRDPQAGNMSHDYTITFPLREYHGGIDPTPYSPTINLHFQHGPIKEAGVNGITNEVLIAIIIDRLEGAQTGPFASDYNADAIVALRVASERLADRTRDREARGVEGQNKA